MECALDLHNLLAFSSNIYEGTLFSLLMHKAKQLIYTEQMITNI